MLKFLIVLILIFILIFIMLLIVAIFTKGKMVYKDDKLQQNPMEGKLVKFVENKKDMENADGKKGHLEVIGISNYKSTIYEKYIKRLFDIIISFFGIIILSPIYIILCIAIIIDDPGPVFFIQKRVGKNKQYFKLHKFRSMKMKTPHDVPTHMLENPEQYITKVGKFIRTHSLDELPQIWDIFIGNMSIIGPRPALWNQDVLIAERDKYNINNIKPGLTGWAQINGRDELEIKEKVKYDKEYAQNISFQFDLKCFFRTILKVIHDDSVVEGCSNNQKNEKK